ncbi:tRNA (adenosine(37)-N6)-threonylcarbamoyltransferase complex ATPase subunit type 1 TsaE [Verrucomicrobiota bacterium]
MTHSPIISHSVEDTWNIARSLVEQLPDRAVLALYGELGSGKTCFVQGLAAALKIKQAVTSPTFTIVNEYSGTRQLYHIDLYRLNSPDEVLALGFEEYLETNGITAIEWAERAGDLIPASAIHIRFETTQNPDQRKISVNHPAEEE